MPLRSAGLLVFRRRAAVEFLLAHPGGPFWKNKDDGAWTIPKGLIDEGEETLAAAMREFAEETGHEVRGPFAELAPLRLKSGKIVHAWMAEADLDLAAFHSNSFEVEWPKRSGRMVSFPEIDRVAYMAPGLALTKILPGQAGFIHQALDLLGLPGQAPGQSSMAL